MRCSVHIEDPPVTNNVESEVIAIICFQVDMVYHPFGGIHKISGPQADLCHRTFRTEYGVGRPMDIFRLCCRSFNVPLFSHQSHPSSHFFSEISPASNIYSSSAEYSGYRNRELSKWRAETRGTPGVTRNREKWRSQRFASILPFDSLTNLNTVHLLTLVMI